jgi:cysteinyl-tRNA synthetase
MATAILGPQVDIHCGGVDNIFPHHEAEIAQSECVTGKQFVRHWLHCAHLMVDGQKMSKSLGNFYTLRDLLARGYSGREIRYALLTVHYRLPLNFTLAGLDSARSALARIDAWLQRLKILAANTPPSTAAVPSPSVALFFQALDDDLNISQAMGVLFDWIRDSNRSMDLGTFPPEQATQTLQDFQSLSTVLALEPETARAPEEVLRLVEERQQARQAKNWARSDEIRDIIAGLGWNLKDTKQGPQLSPLSA